jgi:amidohydrolase
MRLVEELDRRSAELTAWRRELHQHPELAFAEHRTARFIADKLRDAGLDPIVGIGGTGVVAVIDGDEPGLSIGLRADMNALPMQDESGRVHASTVPGQAHSCGHDGHSVAMLGVAGYLARHRPKTGRVVLIFQPAEETAAGARAMINDGLLTRFPLDEVYAFHNMPSLDAGTAAVEAGTTLNGASLWEVTLEGVGGHGASFYTTVDPLQAAARLVTEISSLVGRYVDPATVALIKVGKLQAGTASNIIPATATVGGTLRARTVEAMTLMRTLLQRSCSGVAALTGCKVTPTFLVDIPPCINADEQAEVAARACEEVLGKGQVTRSMSPLPFTDDFAHLLAAVPGAYLFLGQDSAMCHHPAYDFDDQLLSVAGSIFVAIINDRLGTQSLSTGTPAVELKT